MRHVAILLFAAHRPGASPLYEETVALLEVPPGAEPRTVALAHARAAGTSYRAIDGEQVTVRLLEVVDVAPALTDGDGDLYSRHFRDLGAYRAFEPMLDGEPL
ncbi:hypothetical protein WHI96_21000 [Pseudonocardia tropica]|uniref:DUF1330 domain-containing protein n=1 Tax=Pseudonocardia tropica TaxID=681289 RepID=A0ABV1K131_9PSEU